MSKTIIINNNLFASFKKYFSALKNEEIAQNGVAMCARQEEVRNGKRQRRRKIYERLELIMSWSVSFIITWCAIFSLVTATINKQQPFFNEQVDLHNAMRGQDRSNNALIILHFAASCFIVIFLLCRSHLRIILWRKGYVHVK